MIDNLRAAVKQADWYDPEIHPRIQSFAAHYGTVFLPTRPYTPQHKGKVESGVKYVKNNALAGKAYMSLEAQCEALLDWEHRIADGQSQTDPNHIPSRRQTVIERNAKSLLNEVATIGKSVGDWATRQLPL